MTFLKLSTADIFTVKNKSFGQLILDLDACLSIILAGQAGAELLPVESSSYCCFIYHRYLAPPAASGCVLHIKTCPLIWLIKLKLSFTVWHIWQYHLSFMPGSWIIVFLILYYFYSWSYYYIFNRYGAPLFIKKKHSCSAPANKSYLIKIEKKKCIQLISELLSLHRTKIWMEHLRFIKIFCTHC